MRGEYGDSDHPYSFSSRVWWRWDGCTGYVFEYANMKAGFGQGGLSFSGGDWWNHSSIAAQNRVTTVWEIHDKGSKSWDGRSQRYVGNPFKKGWLSKR